jgi:hypothetical protein
MLLNLFTYLICLSPRQIGCIASIGRLEDVPDKYLMFRHNIRATKIGGISCSFGPTETGSIRCAPNTLQIGGAADIAGSPGPVRAAPDRRLIRCLILCL